jgi:peptidoglycan/xylan/chitin deacetylase (PgdA/CDA1 family)
VSERFRVALTLDAEHPDRPAGPPDGAERILDTLVAERVRATFFVQGRWARANPDASRRIADDGHLVGNHSTYHARMPMLSDVGIRVDVADAGSTIAELTGADPRPWFRCPFGEGRDDPRVVGALSDLGYRNVHWHVESEDWEPWRSAADVAADSVDATVERGDGAVVLLHTWPRSSADALPLVIAGLREAGATFVTVDELDALP